MVWANGSAQSADDYRYFLRHLASWGFVVVSSPVRQGTVHTVRSPSPQAPSPHRPPHLPDDGSGPTRNQSGLADSTDARSAAHSGTGVIIHH